MSEFTFEDAMNLNPDLQKRIKERNMAITIAPEIFSDIRVAAEKMGLKTFDTALRQDWVDRVYKQSADMRGTTQGIYPYGFVWCYDKSPYFGEPVPVTGEARMFAKFMLINPRVFEGIDW